MAALLVFTVALLVRGPGRGNGRLPLQAQPRAVADQRRPQPHAKAHPTQPAASPPAQLLPGPGGQRWVLRFTPGASEGLGPASHSVHGGCSGAGSRGRGQPAAGGERGLRAGETSGRQRVQAGGLLAWWVTRGWRAPARPSPPGLLAGQGPCLDSWPPVGQNGTGPCDRCSASGGGCSYKWKSCLSL